MTLLWFILLAAAALVVAGQLGAFRGHAPTDLGVRDGRLKPPARTPNSVSSQTALHADHPQTATAAIEPLRYTGDGRAAMKKMADALRSMERTTLVREEPDYLYAQSTTRLMRYTDDLELWLDGTAGVIQVRSASRIGRKDFGVNRARVERLRAALG